MATTTPNFGWDIPQSTDLVKDGATAIAALGTDIDSALVDLKGGTTGQVLSKNSNTDLDFTWVAQDDTNAIQNTIVDAKGDLISATAADVPARLASSGVNGDVLTIDTSTATGLKWSAPASTELTWTIRNANSADGNSPHAIAYNGTNLYVAVCASGFLYTSSNGTTWTSRTSGFGGIDIQDVAFGNGIFVAVGNNGIITTSTDGTTWTARTANMSTNQIRRVVYANGYFVAVGVGGGSTNTGGVTYSTDGITWTRKSMTPAVGAQYNTVTWNGTNWFVGTQAGTNNALYASDPSSTWTAININGGNTQLFSAYDGTRTIVSDASQSFFYSTSSTYATWTAYLGVQNGAPNAITVHRNNYYYNGRIYQLNGTYLMDFSTTPASNTFPTSQSAITFSPYTMMGSTASSLNNNLSCIWAGAAGQIVGGSFQSLFTTF